MHHENLSWIQKGQPTHKRNNRCVIKRYSRESVKLVDVDTRLWLNFELQVFYITADRFKNSNIISLKWDEKGIGKLVTVDTNYNNM